MDNIKKVTAVSLPNPIDRLIERWWEDHFPGSAVARDTAAWNVAHAAKETLKRLILDAENRPQTALGDGNLVGSI